MKTKTDPSASTLNLPPAASTDNPAVQPAAASPVTIVPAQSPRVRTVMPAVIPFSVRNNEPTLQEFSIF